MINEIQYFGIYKECKIKYNILIEWKYQWSFNIYKNCMQRFLELTQ